MLQPHPNLKNGHCPLGCFAPVRNLSAGEYGEAAQCALVSTMDTAQCLTIQTGWVVSGLLNEANGTAEDFFRACQAELYWTQQIRPENCWYHLRLLECFQLSFLQVHSMMGLGKQASSGRIDG